MDLGRRGSQEPGPSWKTNNPNPASSSRAKDSKITLHSSRGNDTASKPGDPKPKSILKTEGGVKEKFQHKDEPQAVSQKSAKPKVDNQIDSLYPYGLPDQVPEKENVLMYKWDKTKGKERDVRDPVNKPLAQPADNDYLGVLPTDSADVAWEHLASDKKRGSIGEVDVPTERKAEASKPPPPKERETETTAPVILPEDYEPPPKPREPSPPEELYEEPIEIEPFRKSRISQPRISTPRRRTLIERTPDYKRNNHCCSPVRVTCIHSPCCLDREKKLSKPTWQLCWNYCGCLTYRKIEPPPKAIVQSDDSKFFCKPGGLNRDGKPCTTRRTTASTAKAGNEATVGRKSFPVMNVYQGLKVPQVTLTRPSLPQKQRQMKGEARKKSVNEESSSDSDETISDSDLKIS